MDQFASKIETLEHHWMRGWMQRDRAAMKAVTARDFIFMLGSAKGVILDRASWLDAKMSPKPTVESVVTVKYTASILVSSPEKSAGRGPDASA